MNRTISRPSISSVAAAVMLAVGAGTNVALATEPCGDFGECKVLIEINSSDGDIGFHFLVDGDDLNSVRLDDPNGAKVFEDQAKGPLKDQKLTETFAESAEPLCWANPEADPEDLEDIVTLEDFLARWAVGTYVFSGAADGGEKLTGETELSYDLPAAPADVNFDGSVVSWAYGADLGNCTPVGGYPVGVTLLTAGQIDAYEVVLEPDVEEGSPIGKLKFSIRVPADIDPTQVTVPPDYLASLPEDTPVKIEVGAIGGEDNATFTEADGYCVNQSEGCDE